MKVKKSLSDVLIPESLEKINFIKEITDILVVCSPEGKILFSQAADSLLRKYIESLAEFIKDPAVVKLIGKGTFTHSLKIPEGILKVNGLILQTDKFLLSANFIPEASKNSLLWDSFFTKDTFTFSPIIENLTGYNSEQLLSFSGKGFNLLNTEEAEEIKKHITSFIIDKSRENLELIYRISSKSGRSVWLKETVLVERYGGKISRYSASLAELSNYIEEKLSGEQVISELKQLNSAKDQFISVLSHDLKSPYTSILGFSEILLSESTLSQDERLEYLSYINLSSQNQLKLINNLLEWSRLVTGRKSLDPIKINLRNIINNVISNNTRGIHKKNLDIKITSDNYLYVQADERLITETLNIIISNAVKYSLPDKNIEIFVNRFRENQVEVIIKDEGVGINEKNKARILRMDKVFSTPGTSGERGTGISLLLADEIVKSHNGELWYYSEEGVGTEFHFTLPSSVNTMLLVDSDESEKQKICNMLKTAYPGFKILMERNFYNAFGKIKKDNPALLILSHKLPFMNGLEFMRTLRKEEKFVTVPVIVYSGELTDKLSEEYKDLGVSDIVQAPVNLKILKDKIEEILK